jgi:hypothetical protein
MGDSSFRGHGYTIGPFVGEATSLVGQPNDMRCADYDLGFFDDIQARTNRKPLRAETVTHVSGIKRHPCVRNGPPEGWRPEQDSNL